MILNRTSCDFFLMNEDQMNAYLIELKGSDLVKAAEQLDLAQKQLEIIDENFKKYHVKYRIIANKCKTQDIHTSKFIRYKKKRGSSFQYKTGEMEENIS